MDDPASSLPFVQQILGNLRAEVGNATTVLGFVGSPWTLAAYCIETKSSRYGIKSRASAVSSLPILALPGIHMLTISGRCYPSINYWMLKNL